VVESHFPEGDRKELKRGFDDRQEFQHGGDLSALLDDALGDARDRIFQTEPEAVRVVGGLLGPYIRLQIAGAQIKSAVKARFLRRIFQINRDFRVRVGVHELDDDSRLAHLFADFVVL